MINRSRAKNPLESIRALWGVLSPRRHHQFLVISFLAVLCAIAEIGNLAVLSHYLKVLVDPSGQHTFLGPFQHLPKAMSMSWHTQLMILGIFVVSCVSAITALRIFTNFVQFRFVSLIAAELGDTLFANVLMRPYKWHIATNSSHVLSLVSKDIWVIYGLYNGMIGLMLNSLIALALVIGLFVLSPYFMLVAGFLVGTFYLLVIRITTATLSSDGQIIYVRGEHSVKIAQESLGGIRDTILDQNQKFFFRAFSNDARAVHLSNCWVSFKNGLPRYLLETFCIILLVSVSILFLIQGKGVDQQIPLLGTFGLGAYRLMAPLQNCVVSIINMKVDMVAFNRIKPYLISAVAITEPNNIAILNINSIQSNPPDVSLNNVRFRYSQNGPWVVDGLDLMIHAGSRVGFVGSTGSGKSTTIDLILGLLEPVEGEVMVAGKELHHHPGLLNQWQRNIGHVPQHIYLIDDSLTANIAFGIDPDKVDHAMVRRAAQLAHIAELIESQPQGYSTVIGERGVCLSGGQRQRLGIARALYKNGNILVFDEATSALDSKTEKEVITAIEGLDRSLTVIMISHRLSTLQSCDVIHVMEHGRIMMSGKYSELLNSSSNFRSLAGQQTQDVSLQPGTPMVPHSLS